MMAEQDAFDVEEKYLEDKGDGNVNTPRRADGEWWGKFGFCSDLLLNLVDSDGTNDRSMEDRSSDFERELRRHREGV